VQRSEFIPDLQVGRVGLGPPFGIRKDPLFPLLTQRRRLCVM
jgi:hypothetical protein